ncbi:class I SAM-dependent methyltransferase [Terasakiella pusilla]|uniref:class I SAM-dependent methyltransferase n=1 Tax=Terasakiella pusilla TaxID=64973 RepID=UPI00048F4680|nr:methyltransferase domain-containing protein [Terasakiella pusilla]
MDNFSASLLNKIRWKLRSFEKLDWQAECHRVFPDRAHVIIGATEQIIEINSRGQHRSISERGNIAETFDFANYIRLSAIRLCAIFAMLDRQGLRNLKVLDYGSYFGNLSLSALRLGYDVVAIDNYGDKESDFDSSIQFLKKNKVKLYDWAPDALEKNSHSKKEAFDLVFSLGTIEHIPHTPKYFLQSLSQMVKPGGYMVVETPNLAYWPQRKKMLAGNSPHPDIGIQFHTQIPFFGHHREFTISELDYMMGEVGYEILDRASCNYSYFGFDKIYGEDREDFDMVRSNETMSEVISVLGRKR